MRSKPKPRGTRQAPPNKELRAEVRRGRDDHLVRASCRRLLLFLTAASETRQRAFPNHFSLHYIRVAVLDSSPLKLFYLHRQVKTRLYFLVHILSEERGLSVTFLRLTSKVHSREFILLESNKKGKRESEVNRWLRTSTSPDFARFVAEPKKILYFLLLFLFFICKFSPTGAMTKVLTESKQRSDTPRCPSPHSSILMAIFLK